MSQNLVYHLPDVQFDYYTIIPHPNQDSLLLIQGKKGWCLPHFVPFEHHFGVVSHINQAMYNQLKINVTVLCCVYNYFNPLNRQGSRVYALENHSLTWQPPAYAHWIKLDELHKLNMQISTHYNLIIDWFKERENYQNMTAIPWAIPGWFNLASQWIYHQIDYLGLTAISPIEQLKNWPLANVMRINTNQGNIYFKATAKMFANEPEITQILTKYYPQHLPKILAINSQYHWILMQDIGGETLSNITNIYHWQSALRLFAEIQIDSAQYIDNLISQGWLDLRLDNVVKEINLLLKNYLFQPAILPLLTFAPQIIIMCKELSTLNIPPTLMHGDLSPRNIFVTADNYYLYFDWSDSCISHPFFDLIRFLYEIEIDFPGVPDIRDRLRDAYLQPWTIYAPIDRLISVFELSSKTLTNLYQAIISQSNILNFSINQETPQTPVNFYIKRLLIQVASYLNLSLKNFQQT